VVASQAGLYGRYLVGHRVACHAPEDGNGTWAEFMATDALGVIPLNRDVTLEQGASLLVNPLTAMGSSQDGQAGESFRFCTDRGRRRAGPHDRTAGPALEPAVHQTSFGGVSRFEMLKQAGAAHVLDSTEGGFGRTASRFMPETRGSSRF